MTEWDAAEYAKRSGLQGAMAAEVLALLNLRGPERVLDVGCGDGRATARIAARVPQGSVLGVDSSRDMVELPALILAVLRNPIFTSKSPMPAACLFATSSI